jgi:hypothetical protein
MGGGVNKHLVESLRSVIKKIIKEEMGSQRLNPNNKLIKESSNNYIKNFLRKNESYIKETLVEASKDWLMLGVPEFLVKTLNLNIPKEDLRGWDARYFYLILDNNANIVEVSSEGEGNTPVKIIKLNTPYNLFEDIVNSAGKTLDIMHSENTELQKLQKQISEMKQKLSPMGEVQPGYEIEDYQDEDTGEIVKSIYKKSVR